jgi:hypothetical protein
MMPMNTPSTRLTWGADDDLRKVFAGRPSEDYYWRTHPDTDKNRKGRPIEAALCPFRGALARAVSGVDTDE